MNSQFKVFIYFFSACLLSMVFCHADNLEQNELATTYQKIYVSSEELIISDQGLFLVEGDDLILLKSIGIDEIGIYVEKLVQDEQIGPLKAPTCVWCGHPIYCERPQGCGGCSNWWCGLRCKCCSPWL